MILVLAMSCKYSNIPFSDITAKMNGDEDSSPVCDENLNTNNCRIEESFQNREGVDLIDGSVAESDESCMDIEQSNDEQSEEEKLNDSENNDYGEDLDGLDADSEELGRSWY